MSAGPEEQVRLQGLPTNGREHRAVFRFKDPNAAKIYFAIAPEMAGEVNTRSNAGCWLEPGDILVLQVVASDVGALRASLNMWLRLVNVAQEMQELESPERRLTI